MYIHTIDSAGVYNCIDTCKHKYMSTCYDKT